MIAVIFEVMPHPHRKQNYLDMAAEMRPLVEEIDGFISVERFQSLTNPEKLLSLSFFRDEKALDDWRKLSKHRSAQRAGRNDFFSDYHLRIAHVMRDYGMFERAEAPQDSKDLHG
ncbi:antibiotic biosynthesis monooxygenase [Sulfitobacter sp. S190]|uniref:antibiotic biosynthesis monooxygenase family protein n=1 Tax=Sulfitobacter sp. S190 TaxID=2867022 RepID=UPI0021A56CCA|nr:antibiotic biosynthesis monooxygenase [Sulfitobacter sp. S190]UWR22076.1 antibiotic biosynthesis monooxygenase [Sulfitobacter sp. S190]